MHPPCAARPLAITGELVRLRLRVLTNGGDAVRGRGTPLGSDTRGLALIEHVLIACLIGIVAYFAWHRFGGTLASRVRGADTTFAVMGSGIDGAPHDVSSAGAAAHAGAGVGGIDAVAGAPSGSASADRDEGWVGRGASTRGGALIARGAAAGVGDVVTGAVEGAVATGGVILAVVREPQRVTTAIAEAVASPAETARSVVSGAAGAASALVSQAAEWQHRLARGDAYTRARMLTGAGATVVPVGAVGNVARGVGAVAQLGSKADQLAVVGAAVRRRVRDGDDPASSGRDGWLGVASDDEDFRFPPPLPGHADEMVKPNRSIRGEAVNLTSDMRVYVQPRSGAFTVAVHAERDATAFSDGSRSVAMSYVAMRMLASDYRGGDVVLLSCESACTHLVGSLRRELDRQLTSSGLPGRVGSIAAPTEMVSSGGYVRGGGHWRIFDEDTSPWDDGPRPIPRP
jgi:hypothetical protein